MRLILLISVILQLHHGIDAAMKVLFMNVPSVFGDQSDPATINYYADACRNCSLTTTGMFYSHDNACNTFIQCISIPILNMWLVHGFIAPTGAMFNEHNVHNMPTFIDGIPNRAACPRVGHPCDTGTMLPVDGDACHGYQVCVNNVMIKKSCANASTGFNVMTQSCDRPCNTRQRLILNNKCRPHHSSDKYYLLNQLVKYADKPYPETESFNVQCNLGYKYQEYGKCGCDPYHYTTPPCVTMHVLHLRSDDDSWRLARNNTPLNESSSLTGDGSIISDSYTNYLYAAFFNGAQLQTFSAARLWGNDLGLYFDISFRFLSMRSDGRPGLSEPMDNEPHSFFALADNSACNIRPTYGCRLDIQSQDKGYVVCYIQPNDNPNSRDNTEVSSTLLDLTQTIDVYFAKDDKRGMMRIVEGGMERTATFNFYKKGVRAIGNSCPLNIGAGTARRYFTGYFFNMEIKKYCGHFL